MGPESPNDCTPPSLPTSTDYDFPPLLLSLKQSSRADRAAGETISTDGARGQIEEKIGVIHKQLFRWMGFLSWCWRRNSACQGKFELVCLRGKSISDNIYMNSYVHKYYDGTITCQSRAVGLGRKHTMGK